MVWSLLDEPAEMSAGIVETLQRIGSVAEFQYQR